LVKIFYHKTGENKMDKAIEDFLNCKKIAVVGVSRSCNKFGNTIYTELKTHGYQVFAINPNAKEIAGDPSYPNIAAIKNGVDGVVISVPPAQAEGTLRDAAAAGVKNVWMQQGSDNRQLIDLGRSLGLNLVSGKCIVMYLTPVAVPHSFHRFFAKLFGQL
jgi:predicted CoA-binding protein